jgi:hypothetical protein
MSEDSREESVYMAKLAEQAERYDEMVEAMKSVAKMDIELTIEEPTFSRLPTRMLSEPAVRHPASSPRLSRRRRTRATSSTLPRSRSTARRLRLSSPESVTTSSPSLIAT